MPTKTATSTSKKTLLVVDDEPSMIELISKLVPRSYVVVGATSAAQAERKLDRGVDLLLCDLRLPEKSGLHVMRYATQARRPPRIIAMSGCAEREEVFAAAHAGALVFLEKPFTRKQVLTVLDAVSTQ